MPGPSENRGLPTYSWAPSPAAFELFARDAHVPQALKSVPPLYESFLLFNRRKKYRKLNPVVVIGVPTEHSLKPCLKSLLELFVPNLY